MPKTKVTMTIVQSCKIGKSKYDSNEVIYLEGMVDLSGYWSEEIIKGLLPFFEAWLAEARGIKVGKPDENSLLEWSFQNSAHENPQNSVHFRSVEFSILEAEK